uniref:Uncharacterized protein n=1 Tax=Octopus bimaculoides TaxID=37653 RepID=A0A0L8HYB2_OCTBM
MKRKLQSISEADQNVDRKAREALYFADVHGFGTNVATHFNVNRYNRAMQPPVNAI